MRSFPSNDELSKLFYAGLSCRQAARALSNISHAYVHKKWQLLGLRRDLSTAIRLANPSVSLHTLATHRRARRIWAQANGPIPVGCHIHHIDHDHTNNNLENLACMPASEHGRLHSIGPEYHIPKHLRPKRKAYNRDYMRKWRKAQKEVVDAAKA